MNDDRIMLGGSGFFPPSLRDCTALLYIRKINLDNPTPFKISNEEILKVIMTLLLFRDGKNPPTIVTPSTDLKSIKNEVPFSNSSGNFSKPRVNLIPRMNNSGTRKMVHVMVNG
ncbi:hypothetical protein AVEN_186854-1 [Araneus ventricosus]|uniref:Uncharacterized protein n=1 Tax=Araneus ventricosus TaxID=182803 RepID=A0A4Y2IIQ8_ARAVE|nr:hypothetical protein AVEN_186854-1 [Araneus ventricosus]